MTDVEEIRLAPPDVARVERILREHPAVTEVTICVPDAAGHLRGKSVPAAELATAVRDGTAMPNFFLVTDVGNDIIPGAAATSLDTGFPNATLRPDVETLRALPWAPSRAIVLSRAVDAAGREIAITPMSVLATAIDALGELGIRAQVATELEFYLFRDSYEEADRTGYRSLHPLYHRHGDHDVLVYERYQPFLAELGATMAELGHPSIAAHGEGGVGQVEMNFPHGDPLRVAHAHTYFKFAAKALGASRGISPTFMAKVDPAQAGSSCHIHCSLRDEEGRALFPGDGGDGLSGVARSFVAGLLRFAPDLSVMYAPYANSYSRLKDGSWAPTSLTWGFDNRTALARVLGSGESMRVEFRLPGADANPYLALAAMLVAGREGVARGLELGEPLRRNGYADAARARVPADLLDAIRCFEASETARERLGEEVHGHLLARAEREARLKLDSVSGWDKARLFENA